MIFKLGFILSNLSFSTSTLGLPTVLVSAISWRFIFVISITSLSIKVRLPTPLRAKASITYEPTPPQPNTATCACVNLFTLFSPIKYSVLLSQLFILIPHNNLSNKNIITLNNYQHNTNKNLQKLLQIFYFMVKYWWNERR